jgi:hypothetical protein
MKPAVAFIVAAATAVFASSAAHAASVHLNVSTGPRAGSQVETFDELPQGALSGTSTLSGIGGATIESTGTPDASIIKGTAADNASPFPTSGVDTTNYLSVFGGSSVTITLASTANYLGLLWGSVDTYNTIQFLDAANNVLDTFTGTDFAVHNGTQGAGGTFYANFVSDVPFLKVVLSSSSNSFEVDDVAISTVPLPAALPLFGAALLGMGAFKRKRRNGQAAV